uniref:Uncharacterized protein n=1 Tax=Sipha flava TaxID=143950 RepID=A0A2S2Q1V3_9HEMI
MNEMVLFILVYFVAVASAKDPDLDMASSKIELTPNNTIQNLQFEDLTYNLTDFTICTWIRLSNLSHTQTIFRLGSKKETLILWRIHVRPKQTMRITIKNRLVASEGMQLPKGQWSHVCFQWKGPTGVWAMFVNAKIHSVGQVPAVGNDTATAWTLRGKGIGTVGDDGAPCRNAWQAYGLYMTGSADASGTPAETSRSRDRPRNNGKRQAVFDSEPNDKGTGDGSSTTTPKPFQWLTKTFAFVKRMFTFVIIPFFKFVRNTFFQTRSSDDTVVDVSETHLTVSEVKFEPPPPSKVTAADDFPDGDSDKSKRHASTSSEREANGADDRPCRAVSERVSVADLVAAGATTAADDHPLSPNAGRYLRMVSDGLNDVGVNAAFVRRAFACCGRHELFGPPADHVVIDWHRTPARAHNVTVSPHVCGRTS